jgi:DNA modification methylase
MVERKRPANAMPAGGGGGKWAEFNRKRAERMAARANLTFVKGSRDLQDLDPVSAAILEVASTGTSIFDPVLCEIAYRWFCPPGGTVLDPFAGGSVRGIVASRLGRRYVGIELREEQVAANMAQLYLAEGPKPQWRVGDAREIARHAFDVEADLVFSCPPYWNLERYSDDPADLSNMGRAEFFAAHGAVIRDAVGRLRPDRFAVWVIGDVRDKDGCYVNLPGRTVEAFEAAGARFYNDAILVTAVGSLPVRVGRQFDISRKLGRTHQNVMVFVKGDPRKATEACGAVEFGEITEGDDA